MQATIIKGIPREFQFKLWPELVPKLRPLDKFTRTFCMWHFWHWYSRFVQNIYFIWRNVFTVVWRFNVWKNKIYAWKMKENNIWYLYIGLYFCYMIMMIVLPLNTQCLEKSTESGVRKCLIATEYLKTRFLYNKETLNFYYMTSRSSAATWHTTSYAKICHMCSLSSVVKFLQKLEKCPFFFFTQHPTQK